MALHTAETCLLYHEWYTKKRIDKAFVGVHTEWELDTPEIREVLRKAYASDSVCPSKIKNVFRIFKVLRPADVVVAVIGQDPYPRKGDARGYAFHTRKNMPRSARSICENLVKYGHCTKNEIPKTFGLGSWIDQGVLLVNTSLNVLEDSPNSHKHLWKGIVEKVLQKLPANSVSLHLGETAAEMKLPCTWRVDYTHPVIPSQEAFQTRDCFGDVNAMLAIIKSTPIKWNSFQ
jgi:uracil DNA glycosylase